MSATIDTWTVRLGFLSGICAVAAWLLVAGSPAQAPDPTASIRVGTLASGELDVSPLGKPVLKGSGLRPGGSAETGHVRIRNQTPSRLTVALRTVAVHEELDGSAWIEVADHGQPVVRGPLSRSHSWSHGRVELARGESRRLRVRVWIPADAPDGWQAARGDLTLAFRASSGAPR